MSSCLFSVNGVGFISLHFWFVPTTGPVWLGMGMGSIKVRAMEVMLSDISWPRKLNGGVLGGRCGGGGGGRGDGGWWW